MQRILVTLVQDPSCQQNKLALLAVLAAPVETSHAQQRQYTNRCTAVGVLACTAQEVLSNGASLSDSMATQSSAYWHTPTHYCARTTANSRTSRLHPLTYHKALVTLHWCAIAVVAVPQQGARSQQ
eukprot:18980-Heterococcus_DN1.PRE.2